MDPTSHLAYYSLLPASRRWRPPCINAMLMSKRYAHAHRRTPRHLRRSSRLLVNLACIFVTLTKSAHLRFKPRILGRCFVFSIVFITIENEPAIPMILHAGPQLVPAVQHFALEYQLYPAHGDVTARAREPTARARALLGALWRLDAFRTPSSPLSSSGPSQSRTRSEDIILFQLDLTEPAIPVILHAGPQLVPAVQHFALEYQLYPAHGDATARAREPTARGRALLGALWRLDALGTHCLHRRNRERGPRIREPAIPHFALSINFILHMATLLRVRGHLLRVGGRSLARYGRDLTHSGLRLPHCRNGEQGPRTLFWYFRAPDGARHCRDLARWSPLVPTPLCSMSINFILHRAGAPPRVMDVT
ncbi:hypothetical protein GGX14DRAFT_579422 [Mycena pura]|uniref:Uncharacterized protein n=1 Tax=Mycena pura TaxID=153505 RepID=A0AAD6UN24_9AGAR|nr:hypothetical protein GGX14DRAFT_579422 [Mycena pura]